MSYTVKQLSELTGLTPRTLRYYDAIGLLRPARDGANDYRRYGPAEVERLRQILIYRELGLPLEEIRALLDAPEADRSGALRGHLDRLLDRRRQVEALIRMVRRTLDDLEGETAMTDKEKFEDLKQQVIRENEAAYGQEVRQRWGTETADACNSRVAGMPREEWEQMQREERDYQEALRRAIAAGDPAGQDAREACRLHRDWLLHYWSREMFTPEAHIALVESYSQDERFAAYYEAVAPGCADFFARAIRCFYA